MPTPREPAVHTVTVARRSPEADRAGRMRSYLIAMGIRTVSFPLAVWAFSAGQIALAWVLCALAIVIPSVAVMIANAVDRRTAPEDGPETPVQGLPAAPEPSPAAEEEAGRQAAEPLTGEVVRSREVPR